MSAIKIKPEPIPIKEDDDMISRIVKSVVKLKKHVKNDVNIRINSDVYNTIDLKSLKHKINNEVGNTVKLNVISVVQNNEDKIKLSNLKTKQAEIQEKNKYTTK